SSGRRQNKWISNCKLSFLAFVSLSLSLSSSHILSFLYPFSFSLYTLILSLFLHLQKNLTNVTHTHTHKERERERESNPVRFCVSFIPCRGLFNPLPPLPTRHNFTEERR